MHQKYPEVIKLRKKGQSYREIARAVGVSKNLVSRWSKNLKLPLSAQKILEKKTKAVLPKLIAANKRKHKLVQIENREIRENALNQIHSLSKYELLLIGTALYWSEGQKRWSSGGQRVHFVNSEPSMIALFLRFLREIMQVPEEELRASIRVHPNIDEKVAINFWSQVTDIPKERFHITTQISRASQGKRPKNSLPHGTLHLYVNISGRRKFQQIKGWIDGLIKQNT